MTSGGKRANSGRKSTNQKHGRVGGQGATLESFYHPRPQNHQQSSRNQTQVEHNVTNTPTVRQNNSDEKEPILTNPSLQFEQSFGRSVTGIVKEQLEKIRENNKNPEFVNELKCQLRKGYLWDPRTVCLHHHIGVNEIKHSWKKHCQLACFHWVPSILLAIGEKEWLPSCPNQCGNQCKKNGFNHKPRIVYGTHENYILNAPERYKCTECIKTQNRQKCNNLPKAERIRAYWSSTDRQILLQIRNRNHGVYELFPCILSHINAIDKKVHDLVLDMAAKHVGPSSVADTILQWHEMTWQRREIQWLSHVKSRIDNPLLFESVHNFKNIEKMPSYFSRDMCGGSPSGNYLLDGFNQYIYDRHDYFDVEVIKRIQSSFVLAIDASYKVGKLIAKHGNQKIFEALHTGTNEYGEIILNRFSSSDNHEEVEHHLNVLKQFGLNPDWVFTDVPDRDYEMLVRVFDHLKDNVNRITSSESMNRLSAIEKNLRLIPANLDDCEYIYTLENARAALLQIHELLNSSDDENKVLIIDMEWPITTNGNNERQPGKVNIVHMMTPLEEKYYLFELYSFKSRSFFGQLLNNILSLPGLKVGGANHKGDLTKLRNDYEAEFKLVDVAPHKLFDVQQMALNRGVATRGVGKSTLSALCQLAGFHIPKPRHIRVGTVFGSKNGSLQPDARLYCMRDLKSVLLLFQEYIKLPIILMMI